MFGFRFLRSAAVALCLYGVLGLLIAAAMVVVGSATFTQVTRLQTTLERERGSLVRSIRLVATTVQDTASSTTDFDRSIEGARTSADTASKLANDTAGTFREMSQSLNIQIFGLQPLASIAPQFDAAASQLQQLAISLGSTRDALGSNRAEVRRVGSDLAQLNRELQAVATSLDQPGVLGLGTQALLPFQLAFYGMCLLVVLQSAFSIVAGIALYRLQRAMGTTQPLFPFLARPALPAPDGLRTATTTAANGDAHDHVRSS
jgi:hypothetical protein